MSTVKVTETGSLPPGQMKSFTVNGKEILIVNTNGKFYAVAGRCTHMGGELAKGKLEGTTVTCPRHGARYDVTTGTCTSGPKIAFLKLKTADIASYKVTVEGNDLSIEM